MMMMSMLVLKNSFQWKTLTSNVDSNKSNIYSKDLLIVMTNRMCFSSSTWYALYNSTMHPPRRTHVKTSILPRDLDSRINFFHLCSRHLRPLLSMCGIPHIYAATAYGLYWGSAVPMAPHPLLCSLRHHEMFFVCPT
jgi:hypothetical protein